MSVAWKTFWMCIPNPMIRSDRKSAWMKPANNCCRICVTPFRLKRVSPNAWITNTSEKE